MIRRYLICLGIFILSNPSTYDVEATPARYTSECYTWDQLDQSLEAEDNMEIICDKNQLCTGIDCTGKYTYTGLITALQKFTVGVCTGLSLLPCANPLELYVYTEMPQNHVNFSRTFTKSELVKIDGASFDASPIGQAQAFLDVDMNTTSVFGKKYVKMGIKMKIRLSIGHGLMEQWPDDMQVMVVPDTLIPVPECQPSIHVKPHSPATCNPDATAPGPVKPPGPVEPPPPSVPSGGTAPPYNTAVDTTSMPRSTPSGGTALDGTTEVYTVTRGSTPTPMLPLGKCKVDEMGSCKSHQTCQPNKAGSEDGMCVCTIGSRYTMGGCVPLHTDQPPTVPIIYPGPTDAPKTTKMLSKNTIIIIGCTLSGVAILVALVIVVLAKYRRYRAQYANHVLLLASQDNDADDEDT